MDDIHQAALLSVARGTGFAGLAIVTTMIALSFDPGLAAGTGSVMSMITAFVLYIRGDRALHVRPTRTEVWLMICREARPPAAIAQKVIGTALREAYFYFSRAAAIATLGLWGIGFMWRMLA